MSETTKKSPIEGCNLQKGEVTGASHSIRSKQIINEQPGIASLESCLVSCFDRLLPDQKDLSRKYYSTKKPLKQAYLDAARDGANHLYTLKQNTIAGITKDDEQNKGTKSKLPAIVFSLIIEGERKKENAKAHTGLIAFDIENEHPEGKEPGEGEHIALKNSLIEEFKPVCAYLSPRLGIRLVLNVPELKRSFSDDPETRKRELEETERQHKVFYSAIIQQLEKHLEAQGKNHLFTVDKGTSDIARGMYPGFEHDFFDRFKAYKLPFFSAAGKKAALFSEHNPTTRPQNGAKYEGWQQLPDYEKALLALARLDPGAEYDTWFKCLCAGLHAGLSLEELERWSATGANYKEWETTKKLIKLDPRATVASLVYLTPGGQDVLTKDAIEAGLLSDNKPMQSSTRQPRFSGLREELNQQQEEDDGDIKSFSERANTLPPTKVRQEFLDLFAQTFPDIWQYITDRTPFKELQQGLIFSLLPQIAATAGNARFSTLLDNEKRPISRFLHIIGASGTAKSTFERFPLVNSNEQRESLKLAAASFWLLNKKEKGGNIYEYAELLHQEKEEKAQANRKKASDDEEQEPLKPICPVAQMVMHRYTDLEIAADTTAAAFIDRLCLNAGHALMTDPEAETLTHSMSGQHGAQLGSMIKKATSGGSLKQQRKREGAAKIEETNLSLVITSTFDQAADLYGKNGRKTNGFMQRPIFYVIAPQKMVENDRDRPAAEEERRKQTKEKATAIFDTLSIINCLHKPGGISYVRDHETCGITDILEPGEDDDGTHGRKLERLLANAAAFQALYDAQAASGSKAKEQLNREKTALFVAVEEGLKGEFNPNLKTLKKTFSKVCFDLARHVYEIEQETGKKVTEFIELASLKGSSSELALQQLKKKEKEHEKELSRLSSLLLENPGLSLRKAAELMNYNRKQGRRYTKDNITPLMKELRERG